MLLNHKEPIPSRFYIFVNQLNPITYHNLTITKTFVSGAYSQCSFDKDFVEKYFKGTIDYMPFVPNQEQDLKSISLYHTTAINDYATEYNAELKRKSDFPLYPSRLSATYA
ncbi:MAG: hypothetical protein PHW73_13470, partial [Atribacterota bacterium]|nr:hypothetical protein [Atribacterota bacterium]